jgi:hypothetical protein
MLRDEQRYLKGLGINPSFTHPYRGQIHTSPRMFIREGANEPGPQLLICA